MTNYLSSAENMQVPGQTWGKLTNPFKEILGSQLKSTISRPANRSILHPFSNFTHKDLVSLRACKLLENLQIPAKTCKFLQVSHELESHQASRCHPHSRIPLLKIVNYFFRNSAKTSLAKSNTPFFETWLISRVHSNKYHRIAHLYKIDTCVGLFIGKITAVILNLVHMEEVEQKWRQK